MIDLDALTALHAPTAGARLEVDPAMPTWLFYGDGDACADIRGNLGLPDAIDGEAMAAALAALHAHAPELIRLARDLVTLRASLTVPERYVGVVGDAVAEEIERLRARVADLKAHVGSVHKAAATGYREGLLRGAMLTRDHDGAAGDVCDPCLDALAGKLEREAAEVCDDAALAVVGRPGRRAERAQVVAWLRDANQKWRALDAEWQAKQVVADDLADAIERGEAG